MASKEKLNLAIHYFNQKDYKNSSQVCLDVFDEEGYEVDNEFLVILAKSALFSIDYPVEKGEDLGNIFLQYTEAALNRAKDKDELIRIYKDTRLAVEKWKKERVLNMFELIKLEPHTEYYVEIGRIKLQAAKLLFMFPALSEEVGEDECHVDELLTDAEQIDLRYRTAITVFNTSKTDLQNNSHVNSSVVETVRRRLYDSFIVAQWLANDVVKYEAENEIDAQRKVNSLKLYAEIINVFLNAKVYENGQPFSVHINEKDRESYIKKLKETYQVINNLDKNFIEPELPTVKAFVPNYNTQSSGGCYVATAVYGSYDCPEVWTLRRFRDNILAETWYGRLFVRAYYTISPTLVKWFGKNEWFKNLWKPTLDRMVESLNERGVEDTPYNDRAW